MSDILNELGKLRVIPADADGEVRDAFHRKWIRDALAEQEPSSVVDRKRQRIANIVRHFLKALGVAVIAFVAGLLSHTFCHSENGLGDARHLLFGDDNENGQKAAHRLDVGFNPAQAMVGSFGHETPFQFDDGAEPSGADACPHGLCGGGK